MPPHIHRHQHDTEDNNPDHRLVGVFHDQFLILSENVADESEDGAPDAGAEQGVEGEAEMVHPGKPGRDGNQVPHHRQQTAYEG